MRRFLLSLLFGLLVAGLQGPVWPVDSTIHEPVSLSLPPGSMLPVLLLEPVSTETAAVGQVIQGAIAQPVYVGVSQVLSRGDRVIGRVVESTPPIAGRNAILKVQFDTITLASGLQVPISTWTETGQTTHAWGGETTLGTKVEIIPYRVWRIGAYGRSMYSGPRAMGTPVSLAPGTRLVIVLQAPVQLYGF